MAFRSLCLCVVLKNIICKMLAADSLMFAWDERLTINSLSVNVCQPLLGPVFVRSRKFEKGGCVFHISLRKKIKPSELKLDLTERKEKKKAQMQLFACLTEQTFTSAYHLYKRLVGLNYLKHAFPFFFFRIHILKL